MFKPFLMTVITLTTLIGTIPSDISAQGIIGEKGPTVLVIQDKGFSIEIPQDWLKDKTREGLDLFVYAPVLATERIALTNVGVVAGKVSKDLTLANFYKVNIENLPKAFDDFQEITSGTGGVPDLKTNWIVFKRKLKTENAEIQLQELQYYIIANEYGYVITFSATPEEYTEHRGIFEKIISSFKVIKDAPPADGSELIQPVQTPTEPPKI